MASSPQLLIGLGNPGDSYSGHRHNVGFMAIDAIANAYGFPKFIQKHGGLLAEGNIAGHKIYLFKPQSYMNLSGDPANRMTQFYKIPVEAVTVFHDELDLPLAKVRIKRAGGHGGHNGLKSLDSHLGKEYQRVRIGIAHPGDKDAVSDYVLSNFSKAERLDVEELLADITRHIAILLDGDDAGFMNKLSLNSKTKE